jgi:hypothetical protein
MSCGGSTPCEGQSLNTTTGISGHDEEEEENQLRMIAASRGLILRLSKKSASIRENPR